MPRTIVFVDDDISYLETIQLCGKDQLPGLKTVLALSPDAGLTEILKAVPDVLVLDFNLGPKYPQGGLEVARGLLQQELSRPITIVVNSVNLPDWAPAEFRKIPTTNEVEWIFREAKAMVSDIEKAM